MNWEIIDANYPRDLLELFRYGLKFLKEPLLPRYNRPKNYRRLTKKTRKN